MVESPEFSTIPKSGKRTDSFSFPILYCKNERILIKRNNIESIKGKNGIFSPGFSPKTPHRNCINSFRPDPSSGKSVSIGRVPVRPPSLLPLHLCAIVFSLRSPEPPDEIY